MPIDPLSWAFGWLADKAGDSLLTWLTPSELKSRLASTVGDWAKALPPDRYVLPEAIFQPHDPDPGPARRRLHERLIDSVLPTDEEWRLALLERWHAVRLTGGVLQPFFELSPEQASAELGALARRLRDICASDERMYRGAIACLVRGTRQLDDKTAVLMINAIEEPQAWSSTYKLHFHLHNPTDQSLLVSSLGVWIDSIQEIEGTRVKKPGAPLVEYAFEVGLPDQPGWTPLVPRGPARFYLKPGEAEFFIVEIGAGPGREYSARLSAKLTILETGETGEAASPAMWLPFERTT
jgi:hypothetical protein